MEGRRKLGGKEHGGRERGGRERGGRERGGRWRGMGEGEVGRRIGNREMERLCPGLYP